MIRTDDIYNVYINGYVNKKKKSNAYLSNKLIHPNLRAHKSHMTDFYHVSFPLFINMCLLISLIKGTNQNIYILHYHVPQPPSSVLAYLVKNAKKIRKMFDVKL